MSKNLSDLSGRKGLSKNLFDELGNAALASGTPDMDNLEKLREEFLIGKANIYGSVSFYDFLKPENKGKKVYICNGSACLTAGTQDKLRTEINKHFSSDEIGEMCCLGRCHENYSFHVNGKNYSGNDIDEIKKIKEGISLKPDNYHVASYGTPVLTKEYGVVKDFYKIFLECLQKTPETILAEIKNSGLRGRGGAGFSMAFKLESCRTVESETKFIVCNADEGDPGAYSDRYIMEHRPHALLMGMMIAGYIVGATHGVVYIRGEYPESVDIINNVILLMTQLKF